MSGSLFRHGHATHPDWRMAVELALAQIEGQAREARPGSARPTLGFVYVTAPFGPALDRIAALLRTRTGLDDWVGTVGHAICATGAEYVSEPAVSLLLGDFPPGSTRLFSGLRRLPAPAETGEAVPPAHTALVHADPQTPDLGELIVDMASKTVSGSVFGGIASGGEGALSQLAGEVVSGGLSGVAFTDAVPMLARVTQGCSALAAEHTISSCDAQFLQSLDGQPALDVLLTDLGVDEPARTSRDGDTILRAMPARRLRSGLLVGLAPAGATRRVGFGDYLVRNVIGIDPQQRVVAVAGELQEGDRAVFCTRDAQAARRDLVRICTELREELETRGARVRGALYVSCVARGASLFGAPSAELELIASQLGPVPLAGFYANGEISGDRLFAYTGVLTLFL